MTFRIRIELENLRKIQQLIEKGLYRDEYDFITRAIKNQLQDDFDEVGSGTLITTSASFGPGKDEVIYLNDVPITCEKITEVLETFFKSPALEEVREIDQQEELYGPGTSGLIWVFHNRFFPVKLVLYELAAMMATQKSNWIKLSELKEKTSELAAKISEMLYENENPILENLTVGFPVARKKLEKRYYYQRNKGEKISIRLNSSKKRFSDQFVGRVAKKESELEMFSGAPYEMGLIIMDKNEDDWLVSLTENGKEFGTMKNSLLNDIISSNLGSIKSVDKIFSDGEVNFILQKIIPRFKLEKIIIDKIVQLKGKRLQPSEISQIFENEKRLYVKVIYDEKSQEVIRKKYKVPGDKEVMEWIVNRHLDLQPVGTAGRLMELGLLKRELEGGTPYYIVV